MPLILSKARVPRRVTGPGVVSRYRLASASARSRPALWPNTVVLGSPVISRRCLNSKSENISTGGDLLRTPPSIEGIHLKSEFEENRDIRQYLRKWQEASSNDLDPVHGPQTTKPDSSRRWVGNMLNDNRETADAGGDDVRTEEDMSDFVDPSDEGEGMHDYLMPGDLVAIKTTDEILRFAIYVRSISKQQQFYTERGKWRIAYPRDLEFVVKGFVPPHAVLSLHQFFPDSIAELGTDMQSAIEGGVPRHRGARFIRQMNEFRSKVQELYRANSIRFDRIHDIVAHETAQSEMTIEQLACKALDIEPEQLNDVILFAVHQAAHQRPFLIDSDQSSLFTNHYVVAPLGVAAILETVTNWVHEHENYLIRAMTERDIPDLKDHPLQKFIQKAQRLIRLSRKVRSPTTMANVGPTSHRFQPGQDDKPMVYREMLTEKFTREDLIIIRFLQLWSIPPRKMTSAAHRSAGSHIMRATGMYTALELSTGTAPLFLQEIGAFMPWDNIRLFDQDLALPGHGITPESESSWNEVEEACQKLDIDGLVDKMGTMRKDWGESPVYCVDNVDAEEIDDGVSLERISGSNDTFWIRVHVANPSAFIDPSNVIMKYAASRVQTLYVPDRTYPMLPKSLTQGHFSLAPGRPTLTFSAKMNLKGEVLDTDVSNGIVRNVVYLTHDKLSSIFEGDSGEPMKPLTVGGQWSNEHARTGLRDKLSPQDEETFHTLRQLMLAFREQRRKNGAMDWPASVDTRVSVSGGNEPLKPSTLDVEAGRYILGDPIIQLHQKMVNPHEIQDMTKRYLVSTLMNLACWISAKWCAERNIPAVYDGTYYHPEYPQLTSENISEYGGDGWLQLGPPKGVSSSRPAKHVPLGLDAYVKSTSPLRRYTDLLVHQQIEAALRFEHEHGRRLDASTSDASALPFSHEEVEDYISRSRWKRNRLRTCDQGSKQFWACMLLFRAFYFAECELPETFECVVHRSYSQVGREGAGFDNSYTGAITSLGVRCHITVPPEMGAVSIFSLVEAKMTGVNLSRTLVTMEVTRVIKPYERVGEWA
ncbi:hypothetical protein BDW59DRAFT_147800 [Aspergillus cavernicola]|uniref:RNB domain-containing protein n=1 Tax=Aspergillus cavernicola TaxID=176166 RepID=A0ABR4I982_9EURO